MACCFVGVLGLALGCGHWDLLFQVGLIRGLVGATQGTGVLENGSVMLDSEFVSGVLANAYDYSETEIQWPICQLQYSIVLEEEVDVLELCCLGVP